MALTDITGMSYLARILITSNVLFTLRKKIMGKKHKKKKKNKLTKSEKKMAKFDEKIDKLNLKSSLQYHKDEVKYLKKLLKK